MSKLSLVFRSTKTSKPLRFEPFKVFKAPEPSETSNFSKAPEPSEPFKLSKPFKVSKLSKRSKVSKLSKRSKLPKVSKAPEPPEPPEPSGVVDYRASVAAYDECAGEFEGEVSWEKFWEVERKHDLLNLMDLACGSTIMTIGGGRIRVTTT
jgi:hypothetical protein